MPDFDPATVAKLLEAGWITPLGDGYALTEIGRKRLRRGFARPAPHSTGSLGIDSTLVRTKPSIKKKHKRKAR